MLAFLQLQPQCLHFHLQLLVGLLPRVKLLILQFQLATQHIQVLMQQFQLCLVGRVASRQNLIAPFGVFLKLVELKLYHLNNLLFLRTLCPQFNVLELAVPLGKTQLAALQL